MPPSRSSRAKKEEEETVPLYADSDSEGDTDHEEPTPKPHRTSSKKRVSDVYDASFTSESGRTPLKSVSLNDDAAEKRRRRKSAKISMMPLDDNEAGPSGEGSGDAERESARPTVHGKQKQLPAVEEAPRIQVSMDVMSSNFEEWMKMATDNKINANNSWNVALIDYFHDMSLLRNNADNSINFQRASFTLDGCVKIWTSRVDSVGTETGKLLSNLANEGRVGDGEDEDEEGGEEGGSQQNRKKKTHRPASTLARDAAQLRSKKLDLGFRVDPLFRKTCADFDEGGAQGLLMNHLSLGVVSDGSLRVVFDASDSIAKDGAEEEPLLEPPDAVNLAEIRRNFLPNLDDLEDKAICHSLEGFSFSKDAFAFDDLTMFRDDTAADDWDDDENEPAGFNDDAAPLPMDVDGAAPGEPPVEDFFVGDQAVNDDYVHDEHIDSPSAGSEHVEGHEAGMGGGGAPMPFDPRRAPNENDLFMAPTEGDGGLMYDYFDHSKMKNWAGPEHWKLRKVVRRPVETADAPAKRREKKEAFKIDFLTPSDKSVKDIAKELFAPVTKGAGITLPNTSRKGKGRRGKEKEDKRYANTLPDDMHFSSRQLVTLFLKPKFSLKMRGQRGHLEDRPDGEVDENYWAQAAADQAAGRAEEDIDQTQGGGAIPFSTQFFQDDYDDTPGFDDVDDSGDIRDDAEAEQELLSNVQGTSRRVRPEFVNYAKRAKRVDVRKLKDNIWKNLDIVVPDVQDGDDVNMDVENKEATDPSEARGFENVITGLKRSYPRDKMEEISTSFCFICLLHLANERGLKLESDADGVPTEDVDDGEKKIGNIWDLKIYRDPDATPAA